MQCTTMITGAMAAITVVMTTAVVTTMVMVMADPVTMVTHKVAVVADITEEADSMVDDEGEAVLPDAAVITVGAACTNVHFIRDRIEMLSEISAVGGLASY